MVNLCGASSLLGTSLQSFSSCHWLRQSHWFFAVTLVLMTWWRVPVPSRLNLQTMWHRTTLKFLWWRYQHYLKMKLLSAEQSQVKRLLMNFSNSMASKKHALTLFWNIVPRSWICKSFTQLVQHKCLPGLLRKDLLHHKQLEKFIQHLKRNLYVLRFVKFKTGCSTDLRS